MSTKEKKAFQTEVKEILDLMIHSLYSHREIFLRELVSNASDALDKIRYEEITKPEVAVQDKHIRISLDKKNKTLCISDNGIGMSYDEVVQNIGTIAYSGSRSFAKKAKELKDKPELIGQFGVGFYSAFMVANKVKLVTQRAGTKEATIWESEGLGEYSIEKGTKEGGCGTSITLYLKDLTKEENPQDFTDQWTIKNIIKKYSDFIEFPVKMEMNTEEPEKDADGKIVEGKFKTVTNDETLNSQKALWLKSSNEIEEKDYNEFYKHLTHDWNEPAHTIHYKAEGTQEFTSLIYIPSSVPFDYNQRDMKYGLSLYVKRVFIAENCEQLLPQSLRFVKGMVDSNDLPLNVSRELIQQDRHIPAIKKAIVSKILRYLSTCLNKREKNMRNFGNYLALP